MVSMTTIPYTIKTKNTTRHIFVFKRLLRLLHFFSRPVENYSTTYAAMQTQIAFHYGAPYSKTTGRQPGTSSGYNTRRLPIAPSYEKTAQLGASDSSNETEGGDETNWRLGSNRGRGHVLPKTEVYWKTSWLSDRQGIGALNQMSTRPWARVPPREGPFIPGKKPFSPGRKPPRFRATFNRSNGSGLKMIEEEPKKDSPAVETNPHCMKSEILETTASIEQEIKPCGAAQMEDYSKTVLPQQDVRLKDGTADWVEIKENDVVENPDEQRKRSVPTNRRFTIAKDCPRRPTCEYHEKGRCPYRHPDRVAERRPENTEGNPDRVADRVTNRNTEGHTDGAINDSECKEAGQDYNVSERSMLEAPSGGEKIVNTPQASSGGMNVFTTPQTHSCVENIWNDDKMLVDGREATIGSPEDQISPTEKPPSAAFTPYNSPMCRQKLGMRFEGQGRNVTEYNRLFSTPKSQSDVEEGVLKRCSKKDTCRQHTLGACPFLHPSEERMYRIKPEVINTWVYGRPDWCYSGEGCTRKMRCPYISEEDFKEKGVTLLGTPSWNEPHLGDEIWDEIPKGSSSVSAIFDEWVEEQSDVLYSAPSEVLKDIQPEPVTPDVSDSVAPTSEWAIKQDTVADKEQGHAWEREWAQTEESNASTTEAQEVPSSEWFPGRCNAPPYDHDEMTASRVTRTIDNVTSDEHKTQLLRHTDDAGFHRPEQTVFTDRRTNIRDTDSGVVAVNNCDSVYYNSGKITATVPNSNNDVNNENVVGVCDNFPINGQRTKWLSMNNSISQVLNDEQSLSVRSEIITCSFGCQFPEVDAANAGVHMLPGEVTKQSARVLEVSGVRSIVDSTCHDTDQHSWGSTIVGHVPRMESNKPREITKRKEVKYQTSNVDRTRCSDKEDGVRENADGIDKKQKTPKVSNDEVRKVEQRDRECTQRERIAEENGQPQCKHEQKILEELKADDGYRGFSEDDHTAVVDAAGHKEPETVVTPRTIDNNEDRRLRNSGERPSDNEEVPHRSTTDDKQTGSGVKAEHGRPIEGVCSHGASEVGCGKHVKKSQGKQKKKKKKYHDRLTNIKTVNKNDGATSTDDGEFNGGGRGEGSGATGGTNNKRKRRNYPRMRAKIKDKNDGGSDVTSHRKIRDRPDIHRKEPTGRSVQRRKTTAAGATNQEPTSCKDEPKSERHVVKMTPESPKRAGSSNKQHRLEDRKETIVHAKEIKAEQESSKEIAFRNIRAPETQDHDPKSAERGRGKTKAEGKNRDKTRIFSGSCDNTKVQIQRAISDAICSADVDDPAQDKNHLICSSHTVTSDQAQVNRDNRSGKMDCVEDTNRGADCNELGMKKGWKSRGSYKGIDRRHQHRTYYKRRSITKKLETGEDVQKGNGTRKLEVDMQVKDIGAKILRNPGNLDSNFGEPWSESCGGEQGNRRNSLPRVKRPDRPIYDAGLARRRSEQFNFKPRDDDDRV